MQVRNNFRLVSRATQNSYPRLCCYAALPDAQFGEFRGSVEIRFEPSLVAKTIAIKSLHLFL